MNAQRPANIFLTNTMPKPEYYTSESHRHSTGCLDNVRRSQPNTRNMDTSEVSLNDLTQDTPSRSARKSRRNVMDSSSSRTAITAGSSFENSSFSDFSRRIGNYSWRSDDSGVGRVRELRNLKGIQRRRSDPVTRRWREQCSKLYREHNNMLDSFPELPQLVAIVDEREKVAARTIQAFVKRHWKVQWER